MEVAYLRSYENMGKAAVRCVSGCTCEESSLDGHHSEKNSQVFLHSFKASQHANCTVEVEGGCEEGEGALLGAGSTQLLLHSFKCAAPH